MIAGILVLLRLSQHEFYCEAAILLGHDLATTESSLVTAPQSSSGCKIVFDSSLIESAFDQDGPGRIVRQSLATTRAPTRTRDSSETLPLAGTFPRRRSEDTAATVKASTETMEPADLAR